MLLFAQLTLPFWSIPILVVVSLCISLGIVLLYQRFYTWSNTDGIILVNAATVFIQLILVGLFIRFA